MPNIQINIKDKVARGDGTIIICGNSDYVAHFDFDSEWDEYDAKTAHFEWGGEHENRVFTGNKCPVPAVYGVNALTVGVFAGDIRSTTPAFFKCVPCGQDSDSIPADPTPDVYNQIMELLNELGAPDPEAIAEAVADYMAVNPITETDPTVPEWAKGEKKPTYTADEVGAIAKTELETAINTALAQAKASGEFDGKDGSPGVDGKDGIDGQNGISPAVSVATITGGNRVTITDADGSKTFDVMDGEKGASGADGNDYMLTDADKQDIAEAAARLVDVPTDEHINSLINTALGVIENGSY